MERRRQYKTESHLESLRRRSPQSDPDFREQQRGIDKELDQILHKEMTPDEAAYADAFQEALKLDGRITTDEFNYIACYMKQLRRNHPLWRVLAVVGLPDFYFLLMVFAGEKKRDVQFPSKSTLHDAILAKYIFDLKGKNPNWKNTEIAQELTNVFGGEEVSPEKVGYILRNRRRFKSPEARWTAETKDLETLARILHAKHRLIQGLD
jgi:hypothetical protein